MSLKPCVDLSRRENALFDARRSLGFQPVGHIIFRKCYSSKGSLVCYHPVRSGYSDTSTIAALPTGSSFSACLQSLRNFLKTPYSTSRSVCTRATLPAFKQDRSSIGSFDATMNTDRLIQAGDVEEDFI